jgi:hypothetical protein
MTVVEATVNKIGKESVNLKAIIEFGYDPGLRELDEFSAVGKIELFENDELFYVADGFSMKVIDVEAHNTKITGRARVPWYTPVKNISEYFYSNPYGSFSLHETNNDFSIYYNETQDFLISGIDVNDIYLKEENTAILSERFVQQIIYEAFNKESSISKINFSEHVFYDYTLFSQIKFNSSAILKIDENANIMSIEIKLKNPSNNNNVYFNFEMAFNDDQIGINIIDDSLNATKVEALISRNNAVVKASKQNYQVEISSQIDYVNHQLILDDEKQLLVDEAFKDLEINYHLSNKYKGQFYYEKDCDYLASIDKENNWIIIWKKVENGFYEVDTTQKTVTNIINFCLVDVQLDNKKLILIEHTTVEELRREIRDKYKGNFTCNLSSMHNVGVFDEEYKKYIYFQNNENIFTLIGFSEDKINEIPLATIDFENSTLTVKEQTGH